MIEENSFEWALKLASDKAWVVQLPNRVVGRVVAAREIRSATGSSHAIVELEEGHTFHAQPKNFLVVEERDSDAYQVMVGGLRDLTREFAMLAAKGGMTQSTFAVLWDAALTAQSRALAKRGAPEEPSR
jgi:hypothetical protein